MITYIDVFASINEGELQGYLWRRYSRVRNRAAGIGANGRLLRGMKQNQWARRHIKEVYYDVEPVGVVGHARKFRLIALQETFQFFVPETN